MKRTHNALKSIAYPLGAVAAYVSWVIFAVYNVLSAAAPMIQAVENMT